MHKKKKSSINYDLRPSKFFLQHNTTKMPIFWLLENNAKVPMKFQQRPCNESAALSTVWVCVTQDNVCVGILAPVWFFFLFQVYWSYIFSFFVLMCSLPCILLRLNQCFHPFCTLLFKKYLKWLLTRKKQFTIEKTHFLINACESAWCVINA